MKKSMLTKKFFKKFVKSKVTQRGSLFSGILIVALAILFVVFNSIYNNRIFPHTIIGSTNFGGLSRSEAENILLTLSKENLDSDLNYQWQDKSYNLTLASLEVDWQGANPQTLDYLFSIGRKGGLLKIIREQFRAVFGSNQALAGFSYNQAKLDDFIKTIAFDIDKPEKDASIEIQENQPIVTPEEIGQRFDFEKNRRIALSTIGTFDFERQTAFVVDQIYPKITKSGAEAALAETQNLLSMHLILKASERTFEIFPKDIAGFITFVKSFGKKGVLGIGSTGRTEDLLTLYTLSPELSRERIKEYVEKIAAEVNQEPKDAKFEVSNGRVQTFQVAQTGYELDREKSIDLIIIALKKGEKTVELPVKVTEPNVKDDASTEGIDELIGEGRTSWRGSPPNRIHNLTLGANNISGTIVQPGQEFSTLKAIGHIGPQTGFLPELVIKNSTQVVPDYGGGLCQVSTTLFRAAIYSGLKVTARTPHSFRVSYYEPPVGMDATIFDPAPDLKFINTMKTPILIWAVAGNNSLVFQIYGTKDGRKVDISDPATFDYTSSPGAIYTESSSMAAGEIRQVERATPGCSASFTYRVTAADGTILENETFVSKYVALANTYLYGPGTEGIPDQEQSAPPPAEETSPTPSSTPTKKGN